MIVKIYRENYSVYGARKVWWQLRRDGVQVGRCRVERLMRDHGLAGVGAGEDGAHHDPGQGRCPGR